MTTTVTTPTYTEVVDQNFFLVPLGGPQNPASYLDRFPIELYSKGIDTHLVRFLYALMGPAGVGWLRKNYLEARLKLEDFGLEGFDLDRFYGDPFSFGRILEEMYEDDPSGALTPEQWESIRSKDARYRNRAIDYINGAKAGNTPLGMKLVARSGLGHEVEVYERYRYLWDQLTDDKIGMPDYGTSGNMTEMVIIPRRELPQSEVQTVTILGEPTGGSFRLKFPVGDDTTNQTLDINYAPYSNYPQKGAWVAATAYLLGDIVYYGGLTYRRRVSGTSATAPASDPTNWEYLIFGGDAASIQLALELVTSIGRGNVRVTGGPLPNTPINVQFTGALANQDVPQLRATSSLTGGVSPTISISTTLAGNDQVDEVVEISPRDKYYLIRALDRIKPVASWVSFEQGRGTSRRQIWNSAYTSSSQIEVIRYVTGQSGIKWPSRIGTNWRGTWVADATYAVRDGVAYGDLKYRRKNAGQTGTSPPNDITNWDRIQDGENRAVGINWIETGVEHKSPRGPADLSHHYRGYHNIPSITSYTEASLAHPDYGTSTSILAADPNDHVGPYSQYQQALYPLLVQNGTEVNQHYADMAPADYPEPIGIQNTTNGTDPVALINGIYPTTYQSLPGVPPLKYTDDQFWGSVERETGDDYLEIDLGSVQPVNYLYFEASQKPYDISVSYDLLDQAPARTWADVQYSPNLPPVNRLDYQISATNPWRVVEMWIEDQGMIFTRFLRIKFSRRNDLLSPFTNPDTTYIRYSVEIRNLRVARNVS